MTEVFASLAFYTFGLVSVGGAVGMIAARRLVHSAIFLVVSFLAVAAIFLLAGADFLSAVQVLIYAGAIMILMLFAIMLTPGQTESAGNPGQKLGSMLVAGGFLVVSAYSVLGTNWPLARSVADQPTTFGIGEMILNRFVLPFELASVLLLAAMVGAILIARED
ncbi:MAG TPA: NADH-quinone oxidoreductase subunit J [Chloroflexota bacterium]